QLEELKPILREKELAAADKLMKNLSRVAEAEKLIELLEKKADKMKREGEKDKAEKVEEELAARKEEKERNVRAEQVYEMVIKHQQGVKPREECAKCGSELDDGGSCSKCTEEKEGTNGSGAKLHPEYRFENFVIGNSNHFAHAAAVAVADDPATTYNPLFIWSRPGLGKTHLLNAIANRILDKHKGMRISYFTTEQFISDLVEHMKKGKLDEFRREYRRADILIVDDIQFLAESERSQEEFFHTFNALYTVDKQIVLASDRPPKEIPTLKQRLVSRFEGGLIVEVQQPDYETRLAILKQKEADKNIHVQDEVLSYIAKSVKSNIRELEGALNKVAAFASFTKRDADLDLAKEVLKDMSLEEGEEEPPPEEKVEASAPVEGLQKLTPGHSYLVEEQSLSKAVELFKHCLKPGKTGMAVVRTNPTRVEKEHKLKSLAELYWLTDRDSKKSKTIPPSLEKLIWEMGTFIEENDGGALLLDGLDYLASANSFDAVTTFIRRMVDSIAETDSILIISLSPDTMEKQQVKILEREMDVISFL
ncbi:MAG: chromosomal replication initiator protein DnaA, partial [Candidatus Thermoplasmatota archaeon]|nr:chromosomal replication initiator protein DnaA [Candidatus Thermoplasmatota archaeon]